MPQGSRRSVNILKPPPICSQSEVTFHRFPYPPTALHSITLASAGSCALAITLDHAPLAFRSTRNRQRRAVQDAFLDRYAQEDARK
jgi:hypothetical protein